MNFKFYIFIFFIFFKINLSQNFLSDKIWEKLHIQINEGIIKTDKNMSYFTFNDLNHLNFAKENENEIQKLYNKQEKLYKYMGIPNYIFIIDNLYTGKESPEDIIYNISNYLYQEYNINVNKSISIIFSIKNKDIIIRRGDLLKDIIKEEEINKTISELKPYLKDNHIYKACNQFIDKIIFCKINYYAIRIFILIIISIFFNVKVPIFTFINKYKKTNENNPSKAISSLQKIKSNPDILNEICSICLENYKKEDIIDTVNLFERKKLIKNVNDILNLKCGHKFHKKCYEIWRKKKDNCPICSYSEKNLYKMIWDIQVELNPVLNNIDCEELYPKELYNDDDIEDNDFDEDNYKENEKEKNIFY